MTHSALSNLKDQEICTVVLHDDTRRDAAWNPGDRRFRFCDGLGEGSVSHDEVDEWWPASVKL
jgi:hypothetical protein